MSAQAKKSASPKPDAKQKRFVSLFCADPALNATRAAIGAGYSEKTAAQQASRLLRNVKVRDAIEKVLAKAAMGTEEIAAQWSAIGRVNLSDFFDTVRRYRHPQVEKPLAEVIAERQEQIDFEEEFADASDLTEKQQDDHFVEQQLRKHEVLRLQIELRRNPAATRIVAGPVEWYDEMELNLAKAHALGVFDLAKSIKPTQHGIAIELPDRLGALERLAKWQGMFVDKVEHSGSMGIVWEETKAYEGGEAQAL
ncbi:terminase small subunit [Hymenobacter lapidiphilus]|uniref:terminase small subunit n=1 Tax=Hymenobacter sp. CCM 8763 TaxID=2303334 RepID=UPI000E34B121|nr:terminase small subunit [Hymenobacter sp. CCM 8763]RFP65917.1 terminase small subunit [Hymenobacter sp. CCM 8763]